MIVDDLALVLRTTRDRDGTANLLEDYVRTDLNDGRLVRALED